MRHITAKEFENATGHTPVDDDLERANCASAGKPGHLQCGWCERHSQPMSWCLPEHLLERRCDAVADRVIKADYTARPMDKT